MDTQKHSVNIDNRRRIEVKGAKSILSFDEDCLVLEIDSEIMIIYGIELKVLDLSKEKGSVLVEGRIDEVKYSQNKKKKQK